MDIKPVKILMVCLGNICRSPLAEGILRKKLSSQKYVVASAGTANYHTGKLPDSRSISVALKNNIDISNQRATQFKISDFDEYDFIFVMDSNNYKDVISLASSEDQIKKVSLILNEINPDANSEVPDPYCEGSKGFDNVYTLLDTACSIIASRI